MTDTVSHEDWLSPLNRVLWVQAFKARKTKIKLRDGREFKINYDVRPLHYKTTDEKFDLVHVQPMDGKFVPSGYFRLDVVTNIAWIGDAPRRNEVRQAKIDREIIEEVANKRGA